MFFSAWYLCFRIDYVQHSSRMIFQIMWRSRSQSFIEASSGAGLPFGLRDHCGMVECPGVGLGRHGMSSALPTSTDFNWFQLFTKGSSVEFLSSFSSVKGFPCFYCHPCAFGQFWTGLFIPLFRWSWMALSPLRGWCMHCRLWSGARCEFDRSPLVKPCPSRSVTKRIRNYHN